MRIYRRVILLTFSQVVVSFVIQRLIKTKGSHLITSLSSTVALGDGTLCQESFSELYAPSDDSHNAPHLPNWLIQRCVSCGYIYPTMIQRKALDVILDGKDCVIQAQTGSGKTLSYLLPLLASIDPSRSAIQAIIVVPTRELGLQVAKVAKRLASGRTNNIAATHSLSDGDSLGEEPLMHKRKNKIMIMNVLQGSENRRQRAWAWAEPPHVVIGTPVELNKMVGRAGMRYNAVQYVVVDEVDACLGAQTQSSSSITAWSLAGSELHELLSRYLSPTYEDSSMVAFEDQMSASASDLDLLSSRIKPFKNHRQTIFASATIPQHHHFIRQCIKNKWTIQDPEYVCISPSELIPPTISHAYVVCARNDQKLSVLRKLILKESDRGRLKKKAMIFFDMQRDLDRVSTLLADSLGAFIWKESSRFEDVPNDCKIIISVLRYEDSLSSRSAAMTAFQGNSKTVSILNTREKSNDRVEESNILRILLSSDLAARGIDVKEVSHVFNFDLPDSSDTYVHRGGRTGRFGSNGMVVSLISAEQEFVLQRLANKLMLSVSCIARQNSKP